MKLTKHGLTAVIAVSLRHIPHKPLPCATSSNLNLDAMPLSLETRKAMRWHFTRLAAATAWARIESRHHYPSDTLACAALENLLTKFNYNAFFSPAKVNDGRTASSDVSVDFADDATWLRLNWGF